MVQEVIEIASQYNSIEYYMYYIITLSILYVLITLVINFISNNNLKLDKKNISFDYYGNKETVQILLDELTPEQSSLRFKFLFASILIKAATWVKAPYLFALYNRLHGFTTGEIAFLYLIDNLSSLLLGPIIGSLNDNFGRKKFCAAYGFFVSSHIMLRLTGSKSLAIFAQIITGICSVILETSFESWLNFESNLYFTNDDEGKRQKNSFLREIFAKQINIDCFSSIALTGVATFLYISFGIFFPFYLCIFFSILAATYILFSWKENDLNLVKYTEDAGKEEQGVFGKIKYAYDIMIKDKALVSVGLIESCFKISLALFSFMWTPLLETTVQTQIHPGAIFVTFMLARLIGALIFEASKKILKTNTYVLSIFCTFTGAISFIVEYYYNSFSVRLMMLIYFDGLSGIFAPLMSSLKSQMIPEKERTTIMTFFRMPINICCMIILFSVRFMSTYTLCLIAFGFMVIATSVNILLFMWHTPPDVEKRIILKSTVIRKSSKRLNELVEINKNKSVLNKHDIDEESLLD